MKTGSNKEKAATEGQPNHSRYTQQFVARAKRPVAPPSAHSSSTPKTISLDRGAKSQDPLPPSPRPHPEADQRIPRVLVWQMNRPADKAIVLANVFVDPDFCRLLGVCLLL